MEGNQNKLYNVSDFFMQLIQALKIRKNYLISRI
jgi:hypothetical protein